ncbi:hypothetical protein YC2023_039496 [Brassica napus]
MNFPLMERASCSAVSFTSNHFESLVIADKKSNNNIMNEVVKGCLLDWSFAGCNRLSKLYMVGE